MPTRLVTTFRGIPTYKNANWSTVRLLCVRQPTRRAAATNRMNSLIAAMSPNDQLTDGGPSVTPELPRRVAGPPLGGALGSAFITVFVQSIRRGPFETGGLRSL